MFLLNFLNNDNDNDNDNNDNTFRKARPVIRLLVNSRPGDYGRGEIDTRTKEKSLGTDLENINKAVAQ